MSKFYLTFKFLVVVLVLAGNSAQALDTDYDIGMVKELIDQLTEERKVILCVANSCDPLAFNKLNEIADESEDFISSKVGFIETPEFETYKIDKSFEVFLPKLLALVPECKDTSHVCPHKVFAPAPKYVFDYTNATKNMIEASKCITLDRVPEAIDIIAKSVSYLEQYKDHKRNYLERALPAITYATNEFRKFCLKV
ncbi:uncharacterized protein LOC106082892 [Stomoxys calcitrans]|uniref:Uncharacterized protein n=1 Tax=Stomoxys calcitrans TaxID=35570 RepID=A0A1I8PWC9_STOCA|nr:uncharacterized protein LOC106082892 [Stomoxys calcitrans]